jgi:hypothetical protein
MKIFWFILTLTASGYIFAAGDLGPTASEKNTISIVLEVINYQPLSRKEFFQPTEGPMYERHFDLLGFKVLSPSEFADKEFEVNVPFMGGSYMNPSVEFHEKIEVRVDPAELIALLKVAKLENTPVRSHGIEQAIRTAIILKLQSATQPAEPAAR